MNRREFIGALAAAGALGLPGSAVANNAFPTRPIRIIVMYPPGGGADSLNRVVADQLTKQLGQRVLVENRPGGGGVIAARVVLNAPADGYTLLHAAAPIMTLAPKLIADASFSPDDFSPVAGLVLTHYLLVARADFPASNLSELTALARKDPGKITCGDWGLVSITRVISELLTSRTGAKFSQIPYKGEAPLTVALLGGQVQLGWITLPSATAHIKSGKLKAIGIASSKRSELLPQVPTFVEQGLTDFAVPGWSGLFVRKGTPAPIIDKLHSEVEKALLTPGVESRLKKLGFDPLVLGNDAFAKMINHENKQLASVLDVVASKMKN